MKRSDSFYYGARQRCNNKNWKGYKNYGGRGIKCLITKEELESLWIKCKASKLKRPSLDRKDLNGNYEYSNCRFIELKENAAIRRNSTKKECPRGHLYAGKNLYMKTNNGFNNRICRECANLSQRKYYHTKFKFIRYAKKRNP